MSSSDFVVVDCAVYPQLNGLSGQLRSFKIQSGHYSCCLRRLLRQKRCGGASLASLLVLLALLSLLLLSTAAEVCRSAEDVAEEVSRAADRSVLMVPLPTAGGVCDPVQ